MVRWQAFRNWLDAVANHVIKTLSALGQLNCPQALTSFFRTAMPSDLQLIICTEQK